MTKKAKGTSICLCVMFMRLSNLHHRPLWPGRPGSTSPLEVLAVSPTMLIQLNAGVNSDFASPGNGGQESGRVVDFRGLEVAFKLCRELCRELRRTQQSPDRHHNPDRNRCEGAQAPAPPPPASRDCLREESKTCGSLLAKHFTFRVGRPGPWPPRQRLAAPLQT